MCNFVTKRSLKFVSFSHHEKFERGDTDCERNFIEKASRVREWKFLKVNIIVYGIKGIKDIQRLFNRLQTYN